MNLVINKKVMNGKKKKDSGIQAGSNPARRNWIKLSVFLKMIWQIVMSELSCKIENKWKLNGQENKSQAFDFIVV